MLPLIEMYYDGYDIISDGTYTIAVRERTGVTFASMGTIAFMIRWIDGID